MIDRNRHFRRLVVIAGLALWGLLGLGAGSARAQQGGDNLPCSSRGTAAACLAECSMSNSFLADCTCLFDNGLSNPMDQTCPEGTTCCWNMPCEKWDGTSQFECLRGGGSPDGIEPKHCGWTPDSTTGGGECACVPPLVHSNYTIEDFIIPGHFQGDFVAPFDCLCPFSTLEEWLETDVCNIPNPLGVTKLAIKLNFKTPSRDSIALKGTVPVPAGFTAAGADVMVNVGGVVKTFQLDAKGKAKTDTELVKLSVKKKKGVVAAQDAKLNIKFKKGSFAAQLRDEKVYDYGVSSKDNPVTVVIRVDVNSVIYGTWKDQLYSLKTGKSGKTK